MYEHIRLVHVVVQQKLTQHPKAIILQLKKIYVDGMVRIWGLIQNNPSGKDCQRIKMKQYIANQGGT